jgi:hypothetical protein
VKESAKIWMIFFSRTSGGYPACPFLIRLSWDKKSQVFDG